MWVYLVSVRRHSFFRKTILILNDASYSGTVVVGFVVYRKGVNKQAALNVDHLDLQLRIDRDIAEDEVIVPLVTTLIKN